jgi:hypothetical protein
MGNWESQDIEDQNERAISCNAQEYFQSEELQAQQNEIQDQMLYMGVSLAF